MRLRRYIGPFILLALACGVAAHASAAPAPTLFRLTVVGTAHEEWTFSAAPVAEGDCRRTDTSEGIRDVTFRTKTPVTVRIAAGRVLPVVIRGLTGTVTLGGANTTERVCGTTGTTQTADCAQTKRQFTGGTVRAESPQPGVLALKSIGNVHLTKADCPREPFEDPGDERHVCTGEDRDADGVGVLLDRGLDDLLRRLVQAGVDHFHAGVT